MAENKARHAFGTLEGIDSALANNVIDAYDILFVKDANGKPYVGWIDKNGEKVVCQEEDEVVIVEGESLPATGEVGKIYVFGEDAYVWKDAVGFVNLCKPTDVSELQTQVTELGEEVESKVDAETVQTMIKKYSESVIEVVEF